MLILGIESSCDETGVALYDDQLGLLAEDLFSQVALHAPYGGVVPELASRDHVRRLIPLIESVLAKVFIFRSCEDQIASDGDPEGQVVE